MSDSEIAPSSAGWLRDVQRLEQEREVHAQALAQANRKLLAETVEWIRTQIAPAMERFARDLRSIGRLVEVKVEETLCRVEVRDRLGILSEFTAEIGTESTYSTKVRDRLPAMSAVFHGVDRFEVGDERVYELLKLSYLSKIKSRQV